MLCLDPSSAVHFRSPSRTLSDAIMPRLLTRRSPRWLLTTATRADLQPDSAVRLREAYSHLKHSFSLHTMQPRELLARQASVAVPLGDPIGFPGAWYAKPRRYLPCCVRRRFATQVADSAVAHPTSPAGTGPLPPSLQGVCWLPAPVRPAARASPVAQVRHGSHYALRRNGCARTKGQ